MRTLTIYPDLKGLWICDPSMRWLSFTSSSCSLKICDESGNLLSGKLVVSGKEFEVDNGVVKLLTEALYMFGENHIKFVTQSGVVYPCAPICTHSETWYFPSPAESIDDEDIIALLDVLYKTKIRLYECNQEKENPISAVLGI